MTHTGPTKPSRDLGVRPPTDVTGLPPAILTHDPIHTAPRSRLGPQETMTTAYDEVAGRTPETRIHADLARSRQTIGVAGGTMWLERPRQPRRRRKTTRRFIVTVAATFAMATATVRLPWSW